MKKKKLLSITIVSVMALSSIFAFTGCGDKDKAESASFIKEHVDKYSESLDLEFAYDVSETLAYDKDLQTSDLGFRNAGSDAEHKAADYLSKKMEEIGLVDVEKVPVPVDKWQFNGASLAIGGKDTGYEVASYASYGTDEEGIEAEIVDVGKGTAADYEGKDVKGKIVLASINQMDEWWITAPYTEADYQGAAAIITYDDGGFAQLSDDMVNMQDICSDPLIPCVSISANSGKDLKEKIKKGDNIGQLIVDNELEVGKGTGYNVIGKIKGKSSDQQILIAGHYDKYFWGFQDDSTAVGTAMSIGKGMIDSGYTPENDIIIVAHCSEEWGASGTEFDWTTGAWQMINTAKPDWAGKTIALINFEMPAIDDGAPQFNFTTVPEFSSIIKDLVSSENILPEIEGVYKEGYNEEYIPSSTMEDGVSYRFAGVPYFINDPDFTNGWFPDRYHTKGDDKDTYSEDTMRASLNAFGALAIYVDQNPALYLDFTKTAEQLKNSINEEVAKSADYDSKAFLALADDLEKAALSNNEEIKSINSEYAEAVENGASDDELASIRDKGTALNKKNLEAFKYIQDELIGLILSSDIVIGHEFAQNNIEIISAVVDALEKNDIGNEEETGALDMAWQINGMSEFAFYDFSEDAAKTQMLALADKDRNHFWGNDKVTPLAETYPATIGVLMKSAEKDPDFSKEIKIYKKEIEKQEKIYLKALDAEQVSLKELVDMLSGK